MRRMWDDGARRHGLKAALIVAGLSLWFGACYPGGITDVAETSTVSTVYDQDVNFGEFRSVTVLDSIFHVVDSLATDTIDISRANDAFIINTVKQNLQSLGYTLIDQDDVVPADSSTWPDIIVPIRATASRNYTVSRWWVPGWGWGWWPGWGWGPGWGWWGPGYGGISVSSFTSGSLFIDMLDVNRSANDTIYVPWFATLSSVLGTSAVSDEQRLRTLIDRAYEQSPYLQVSGSQ